VDDQRVKEKEIVGVKRRSQRGKKSQKQHKWLGWEDDWEDSLDSVLGDALIESCSEDSLADLLSDLTDSQSMLTNCLSSDTQGKMSDDSPDSQPSLDRFSDKKFCLKNFGQKISSKKLDNKSSNGFSGSLLMFLLF
jgi:hypothetical protein